MRCHYSRVHRKKIVPQSGLTLLELIIASAILIVLASAALPVFKFTVMRAKEYE